jgi:FOG: WD40-like repeat
MGGELNMRIPSRTSPIVFQELVFVMRHDNQLFAVEKDSGEVMWTHRGILESATILSSTAVAGGEGQISVLHPTGEINAIRTLKGSVKGRDTQSRTGSSTPLSEINAITGR